MSTNELKSASLAGWSAIVPRHDGPAAIEFGVARYFGESDLDRTGMRCGWATPEEAHNWNDGGEAVLELTVPDPGGACIVEVEGEPYLNEKIKRQDVVLYVNGHRVGFWRLAEPGACMLSARVEREQLFHRANGAVLLKCCWSFPHSVSPSEKGLSDDTRELAFCFRSIALDKVDAA